MGASVKLVRAGGMECVVRAQISRMFAYEAPEVGQDDVVMAADVDAFVMSEKVTLPLRRDRKIWEAIQLLKIIRSGSKAIFGPFLTLSVRLLKLLITVSFTQGWSRYRKYMSATLTPIVLY